MAFSHARGTTVYTVTIKRTITTVIEVRDATSPKDAARIVKEYGEQEAISDFPVLIEKVETKIARADKH
jgi:hypothetical protein